MTLEQIKEQFGESSMIYQQVINMQFTIDSLKAEVAERDNRLSKVREYLESHKGEKV